MEERTEGRARESRAYAAFPSPAGHRHQGHHPSPRQRQCPPPLGPGRTQDAGRKESVNHSGVSARATTPPAAGKSGERGEGGGEGKGGGEKRREREEGREEVGGRGREEEERSRRRELDRREGPWGWHFQTAPLLQAHPFLTPPRWPRAPHWELAICFRGSMEESGPQAQH